ncbi:MAG: MBL fold metallo-hydrolase [Alphaproteobacteria bacterium]|nr:MBL fold metallo-hydrolase [Alphaproteobacteria bacterium]
MARWQYEKDLHEIGDGLWAYLLPDGSWGWSNAGLVVDGDQSLLVDTLFDLKLTDEMLVAMRRATPAAQRIDKFFNTHANADHVWGNQRVRGAEIIGSRGIAEEFDYFLPETLVELMAKAPGMGTLGYFITHCFDPFDFRGTELTPPTTVFDNEITLNVGARQVEVKNFGPAHTRGDSMVWLPRERVLFTGDLLFVDGHPVTWEGPIANWQRACDWILGLDVDVIVPGHGPIVDKERVCEFKGYLDYIERETRKRFDAGMSEWDATCDISLDDYSTWGDAERLYRNVAALYREFRGERHPPEVMPVFAQMAEFWKVLEARRAGAR